MEKFIKKITNSSTINKLSKLSSTKKIGGVVLLLILGNVLFGIIGKEKTAKCPQGFLPRGAGYCQQVKCRSLTTQMFQQSIIGSLKDDENLIKQMKEAGLSCKGTGGMYGSMPIWGDSIIPAAR